YRPLPSPTLVAWLGGMGQHLFAPPNVKGWPGGRSWLNTSTMLERDNFAGALATGTLWTNQPAGSTAAAAVLSMTSVEGRRNVPRSSQAVAAHELVPPLALDPARLLREERTERADNVARVLLDHYLTGGVRPEVRTRLVAFLAEGQPTGPALDQRA